MPQATTASSPTIRVWIVATAYHGLRCAGPGISRRNSSSHSKPSLRRACTTAPDSRAAERASKRSWSGRTCAWANTSSALSPLREAYAISLRRDAPDSANRGSSDGCISSTFCLELEMPEQVRQVLRETPPIRAIPGSPAALPDIDSDSQSCLGSGHPPTTWRYRGSRAARRRCVAA